MFALFVSLYYSMFRGIWSTFNLSQINASISPITQKLALLITSIFNQSTAITDFAFNNDDILFTCAFVLALITSIGIVVMAAKGVKKAFGIFFGQIR